MEYGEHFNCARGVYDLENVQKITRENTNA